MSPVDRSFTHVGPGTPASAWRAEPAWGTGEPLTLDGVRRLVVVAAHPDDESLGAGGLVATARAQGLEVLVTCATDGEGSHPESPTHEPVDLARVRREEGVRAAAELGVSAEQLHRLGVPDGAVEQHVARVTTALVDLVGDGDGTVIVSPWRRDGHPDHEAVGRAASAAARRTGADLWEFPVWFWHWSQPAEAPWGRLRPVHLAPEALAAKQRAIAAHRSQVQPLSRLEGDEVLLVPELLEHFAAPFEHFVRTPSLECADDSLDDLHREHQDPWGVETRWYEERKRDLVLAMLPRRRFERTLELGCSTGALADALSRRSDRVTAVDRSATALAAARRRFDGRPEVTVVDLDVAQEWPEGSYDLVVVSEVGYFLSPVALDAVVAQVARSLAPDGVLVLCHWRHQIEGWVLDADEVHARFEAPGIPPLGATYRDRDVEVRVCAQDSGWPDPST